MSYSLAKLMVTFTLLCVSLGMYQVGKYQGTYAGYEQSNVLMAKHLRLQSEDSIAWDGVREYLQTNKNGLPPSLVTTYRPLNTDINIYLCVEACATILCLYLCVRTCTR